VLKKSELRLDNPLLEARVRLHRRCAGAIVHSLCFGLGSGLVSVRVGIGRGVCRYVSLFSVVLERSRSMFSRYLEVRGG